MGGHIIGGSDNFTYEDMRKLQGKLNDTDDGYNAEALFDLLEKAAGRKRRRSRLVFWAGYIVGSLCTSAIWWYF